MCYILRKKIRIPFARVLKQKKNQYTRNSERSRGRHRQQTKRKRLHLATPARAHLPDCATVPYLWLPNSCALTPLLVLLLLLLSLFTYAFVNSRMHPQSFGGEAGWLVAWIGRSSHSSRSRSSSHHHHITAQLARSPRPPVTIPSWLVWRGIKNKFKKFCILLGFLFGQTRHLLVKLLFVLNLTFNALTTYLQLLVK